MLGCNTKDSEGLCCRHLGLHGVVQGVGFRPFVHRLAGELGLSGWIRNTLEGVEIQVEGTPHVVAVFERRLCREKPELATIVDYEAATLAPAGLTGFEIRSSSAGDSGRALILPDIATCPDCVREIFDPADRRYLYPFTNCTQCGPRFSIIESLPYDRARTAMREFKMCDRCEAEYLDPSDRRFHAQPNACPSCGPQVELQDARGLQVARRHDAIVAAAAAIRDGRIVAIKGLGGFQLMADASNDRAVRRLRQRKNRDEKPFAVMVRALDCARQLCHVSTEEARLLRSIQAPIVLLRHREGGQSLAASVAPNNPYLGVMVPYTPLHHLLMHAVRCPVICTSGNRSDEPICIDEIEAVERLGGMVDCSLVHDRRIVRHVDDSIARVAGGQTVIVRRARGYAPLPLAIRANGGNRFEKVGAPDILAVGAHQKNTIAVASRGQVYASQHIGDLTTTAARRAFESAIEELPRLVGASPAVYACDLHPDYSSTIRARAGDRSVIAVQHHHAHVAACMVENDVSGTVLGVSWDGTGLGTDGTIWGGEFLLATRSTFERFAALHPFRLPGGDKAAHEPRRSALGVLFEAFSGDRSALAAHRSTSGLSDAELRVLHRMLARGCNAPITTSAGRLFDAVASIIGIRQRSETEGLAAMELEFAAMRAGRTAEYPFDLRRANETRSRRVPQRVSHQPRWVIDWRPMIRQIVTDHRDGCMTDRIAGRFHRTLVEMIMAVARRAGERSVVLTGGCFQNVLLLESCIRGLQDGDFQAFWHRHIPTNDGGISFGQAVVAATRLEETR